MAPDTLRLAEFFTTSAEAALKGGDPDAAPALAGAAQANLDAVLAAGGQSDRQADDTAAYYRRMLS